MRLRGVLGISVQLGSLQKFGVIKHYRTERGIISAMKVATGKVVDGKIILEGEALAEGSVVTVDAREDDETFDVSPEEEQALLAAIAQAERGEVVSWEQLREQLRRFG